MQGLKGAGLKADIEKIWGRVGAETQQEKQNYFYELKLVLRPSGTVGRSGVGDAAAGRTVFTTLCGSCHKLFGEGGNVGPDLTSADRKNVDHLLLHIIDPSL